jgi:hypothetical protein
MQVAKITLWDGSVYHTDDFSTDRIRAFLDKAKAKLNPQVGTSAQIDLIEMTPEEYAAIPATVDSAELFA